MGIFSVIFALCYRDILRDVRSPTGLVAATALSALTMASVSAGMNGFDPTTVKNVALFVATGFIPFHTFTGGLTGSMALMLPDDDQRFTNLYFVAPVRRSTIVLGRLVVVLGRQALEAGILILIVRWILHVQLPETSAWFSFWGATVLSAMLGAACGIQLAVVVKDSRSGYNLVPLVTMPQMLFGGIFMPITALPTVFAVITYLVPVRYSADACRNLVSGGALGNKPLVFDLAIIGAIILVTSIVGIRALARIEIRP